MGSDRGSSTHFGLLKLPEGTVQLWDPVFDDHDMIVNVGPNFDDHEMIDNVGTGFDDDVMIITMGHGFDEKCYFKLKFHFFWNFYLIFSFHDWIMYDYGYHACIFLSSHGPANLIIFKCGLYLNFLFWRQFCQGHHVLEFS